MPDMRDYLMFEIAVVFEKQDMNKKAKVNTGFEISKVLDDSTYIDSNAEEEGEEDDDRDFDEHNGPPNDDRVDFWESLEVLNYENATVAANITFK